MTALFRRLVLAALLCLLWCGPAGAGERFAIPPRLEAATQAVNAGRFAEAAANLEAAYAAGARNAGLGLAAARAWERAGDKGRMLVWLLRANRLDPGHGPARMAVLAAGLEPAGWPPPLTRLTPRRLVWLAVIANTVFWLGLARARWTGRRLPGRAVLSAGLVLAGLWLLAVLPALGPMLWPQGVVLAETRILCAPEPGAEALFTLPAGRLVGLGPGQNGFRRIRDGADRLGWMPEAGIASPDP